MTGARWVPKLTYGVGAPGYVVVFHGNSDRGQKLDSIMCLPVRIGAKATKVVARTTQHSEFIL